MEQAQALKQLLDTAEATGLRDLDAADGLLWTLRKVHRGFIRVSVPADSTQASLLKCRGIADMPAEVSSVSMEELVHCVVQLRSTWDETLKQWRVLWHDQHHTLQIALMEFIAPWPTIPRKTIVCLRLTKLSVSEVVVTARTVPRDVLPGNLSAVTASGEGNAVEGDLQHWVLRIRRNPSSSGWQVGVVMSFDAKGSIPGWLLSTASGTYPTILSDLWKLLVRRKKSSQSISNEMSPLVPPAPSSSPVVETSLSIPEANQTLQKTAILCGAAFLLISTKFVVLLLTISCWALLPEEAKKQVFKTASAVSLRLFRSVSEMSLIQESVWNGLRADGIGIGLLTVLFVTGALEAVLGLSWKWGLVISFAATVFPDSSHVVLADDEVAIDQ
eukprot:TRINITY_DN51795_c0_g1_i1.p1 TRINITY_DN51795_c0_g1~~TRINITY_DN51795_c0_g1_i1.p1  ORF type:complete len:395 (-),score=84.28 TRINITY_DN51795_c0_g1_i1:902-2062(-)